MLDDVTRGKFHMFAIKHTLINALTVSAFCFSSITFAVAQENTQTDPAQTVQSQPSSQDQLKTAHKKLTVKAKESEQWAQKTLSATKGKALQANHKVQSLQHKALPLRQKIQAKMPKGNVPGESTFQSVMKKTSAPAIFVGLAFIFAVWILGFATSPGRD